MCMKLLEVSPMTAPGLTQSEGNTSSPTVSIAMAAYNGERFLREQLETIRLQTLQPLELVVTDDGSTDSTLALLEDFAKTVSFPIHIYRNETRLRYADNFLKAASLCQGDLVAFCDQDDLWLPEKLATCARVFTDRRMAMAMHSAQVFSSDGLLDQFYPKFPRNEVIEPGSTSPFVAPNTRVELRPGYTMVVRKELIALANSSERPPELYGHDYWLWFLAASMSRVAAISDILVHYRAHETNVCGAPVQFSSSHKLKTSLKTPDYDQIAAYELTCAAILNRLKPLAPPSWRPATERSVRRLQLRARFHGLRMRMYQANTPLLRRALVFARLLVTGGYLPDSTRTRLGLRAGLKDVLIGVIGLRRSVAS